MENNEIQYQEYDTEEQRGIIQWIKDHKKHLIIAGLSFTAAIVTVMGLKNKAELESFFTRLQEQVDAALKTDYSDRWLKNASDSELDSAREKVRIAFCSSGNDMVEATRLQNLLWQFDREISRRAWGDELPHAPAIHREHGWYLPNDD